MRKAIVLAAAWMVACGALAYAAQEPAKVDAKALFEDKCSRCHSIERPKSARKTAQEWQSTVMRMKNVNGCPITDDEAKTIIEYLSATYGSN